MGKYNPNGNQTTNQKTTRWFHVFSLASGPEKTVAMDSYGTWFIFLMIDTMIFQFKMLMFQLANRKLAEPSRQPLLWCSIIVSVVYLVGNEIQITMFLWTRPFPQDFHHFPRHPGPGTAPRCRPASRRLTSKSAMPVDMVQWWSDGNLSIKNYEHGVIGVDLAWLRMIVFLNSGWCL